MNRLNAWHTAFGEEEIHRFSSVFNQEKIKQGSLIAEFEAKMADALDVPFAVATTSGSVALLMALTAQGIGQGDEVIVPNRASVATAHAVMLLGATVKLVDVQPDHPTLDVKEIFSCLTARTKAVIPVHLNGRACDLNIIRQVADEYDLLIIEDACQALFSKNQSGFLGTQGDAGCFSFGGTKLISTDQGGLVVTRDADMYGRLQQLRNHGKLASNAFRPDRLGFNFNFTDIQAACALNQMQYLQERTDLLVEIYQKYENCISALPFIDLIGVGVENGEVPLYVEVLCEERDQLQAFLAKEHIQTHKLPPSLNLSNHTVPQRSFCNSEIYDEHGLRLPCGFNQNWQTVGQVTEMLEAYAEQFQAVAA